MAPPARGELTPVQEEPDAASPPSDSMRNSNNSNPTAAVAEASDATETENLNAGDAATEVARILCCFMRKLWWLEMVNFNFYRGFGGYWDFGFWDVRVLVTVNLEWIWH